MARPLDEDVHRVAELRGQGADRLRACKPNQFFMPSDASMASRTSAWLKTK